MQGAAGGRGWPQQGDTGSSTGGDLWGAVAAVAAPPQGAQGSFPHAPCSPHAVAVVPDRVLIVPVDPCACTAGMPLQHDAAVRSTTPPCWGCKTARVPSTKCAPRDAHPLPPLPQTICKGPTIALSNSPRAPRGHPRVTCTVKVRWRGLQASRPPGGHSSPGGRAAARQAPPAAPRRTGRARTACGRWRRPRPLLFQAAAGGGRRRSPVQAGVAAACVQGSVPTSPELAWVGSGTTMTPCTTPHPPSQSCGAWRWRWQC